MGKNRENLGRLGKGAAGLNAAAQNFAEHLNQGLNQDDIASSRNHQSKVSEAVVFLNKFLKRSDKKDSKYVIEIVKKLNEIQKELIGQTIDQQANGTFGKFNFDLHAMVHDIATKAVAKSNQSDSYHHLMDTVLPAFDKKFPAQPQKTRESSGLKSASTGADVLGKPQEDSDELMRQADEMVKQVEEDGEEIKVLQEQGKQVLTDAILGRGPAGNSKKSTHTSQNSQSDWFKAYLLKFHTSLQELQAAITNDSSQNLANNQVLSNLYSSLETLKGDFVDAVNKSKKAPKDIAEALKTFKTEGKKAIEETNSKLTTKSEKVMTILKNIGLALSALVGGPLIKKAVSGQFFSHWDAHNKHQPMKEALSKLKARDFEDEPSLTPKK